MLRIATDGAADIPAGWEKEYDLKVIPINIHFGEKTFIQYVDMDFDGFYKEVASNKTFPKTSQPSPHQFVEFYRNNFQKGDTVLSIHVTSKLSGTYASCEAAAKELKGEYNIIPFDSLGGSMGIAFMCRTARKMEREGKSVDEIVKALEALRGQVSIILTLDTLEFAKRSGRVLAVSLIKQNHLRMFRCIELNELDEHAVIDILAPTFAFAEDEFGERPKSLLLSGFGRLEEATEALWREELGAPVDHLSSRFGPPGPANGGVYGFLERVEN